MFLWNEEYGYPVVSYNNEFRQIVMEGGHASLIASSDITAAAANTAYSITFDAPTNKSTLIAMQQTQSALCLRKLANT